MLVFIVEDDRIIRVPLADELRDAGHRVQEFLDSHHVLNAIQRRPVDVVITDIKLPFMSGLELLSEIKSVNPNIPVIVITAYGSENIASEAMKRGAYEFIEKPFELDEMTDLLERLKEEKQIHHNY